MQTDTIKSIQHIIAVASGKGGVGKSTTAVNLALALQAQEAKVGLLDADIYGPSQPHLLGIQGQPDSEGGKLFLPMQGHGLSVMSIGFLIDTDTPMVWRGPMVISALQQLLFQTKWPTLDYLLIDLPPGTGDIQLSLAQKVPLSGALMVTTPQDLALLDVRKAIAMFNKVNVPILGIVENMSTHTCSACGHQEAIFGSQGADQLAQLTQAPLLGRLPLAMSIREQADSGEPIVVSDPQSVPSQAYAQVAEGLQQVLAARPKDYRKHFPKIVVEHN